MSKELEEALEIVNSFDEHDKVEEFDVVSRNTSYHYEVDVDCMDTLKEALIKAQEYKKKADALKELIKNHIEFVVEEDRCYFKIKNSKGKEKSFTSYTMLDFWKEVLK